MNTLTWLVERTAERLEPIDLELTRLQVLQRTLLDVVAEARCADPETAAAFISFLSAIADREVGR
jgi:hypothetical protein